MSRKQRNAPAIKELAAPSRSKFEPTPDEMGEIGNPGLKEYSGFINEAYHSDLFWPTVQPLYSRLRRSVPEIVMVRQAFTAWARHVKVECDLPEEPSDDDKRYQDFIYQVFSDVAGGVTGLLDTMVNHVPFYGWGWWDVAPGVRSPDWTAPDGDEWQSEYDDGLIGLRRVAWRDTSSFFGWDFDEKQRLRGMVQQAYPNPKVTLPLDHGLHLTFGDPNNPEGLSPLEAVWRLERIRHGFEVVMGIGYEHAAGHLSVTKTETGAISSDDKAFIKNAARSILTAQEGNYAYWPHGLDGKVVDIPFAAGSSLLTVIKHYGIMMLGVYTMQWMGLNTMTDTGALASASDTSDMAVFTFNSMMAGFGKQFDEQVGKRLYRWNKDSFPGLTKRPTLRLTEVDKTVPLTELGQFMQAYGGMFTLSEDDLKAIRKRSGFLPEVVPQEEKKPAPAPIPATDPSMMTPEQKAQAAQDALQAALSVYREGIVDV